MSDLITTELKDRLIAIKEIVDQKGYDNVLGIQRECRQRIKEVEKGMETEIKKANELHKSLTAKRKAATEPYQAIMGICSRMTGAYIQRTREAEEKAQKILEQQQRQAAKELVKKGDTAGAVEIMAKQPDAPKLTPETEGTITRTTYTPVIVDADKIPREWLIPDIKAINAHVQRTKGKEPIPGVEIETTTKTHVRG